MEGGNNVPVNFSSGLDIHSSDMLVSVGSPKFQHKWQQEQGMYMPNSLRYEQNGWAVDWNVVNFDYKPVLVTAEDGTVVEVSNLSEYVSRADVDGVSALFVLEDKVLSVDNLTAEVSNRKLSGVFNGKSYTVELPSISVTPDTVSVDCEHRFDGRSVLTFEDLNSRLSSEFTLYTPTSAENEDVTYRFNGFSDDTASWDGSGIQFNTATSTMTIAGGTVDRLEVSEPNVLDFDFTKSVGGRLKLNLNTKKDILGFTGVSEGVGASSKIVGDGTQAYNDVPNKYEVVLSGDSFDVSNRLTVTFKLPVWLTIKVDVESTGSVALPDNTALGNVQVNVPFAQTLEVESVLDGKISYYTASVGWNSVPVTARYSQIRFTANWLEKPDGWQPYGITPVTTARNMFNWQCFPDWGTTVSNRLGGLYTLYSATFVPSNVVEYNGFSWSDTSSSVWTVADLSQLPSVKIAGDTDITTNMTDDEVFAEWLSNNIVSLRTLNRTPTAYSATQAAVAISSAFNGTKYLGTTYERTTLSLAENSSFYPFEYIPCTNVTYNGNTVKAYWYDGTTLYTDVDEAKRAIMGTYSGSRQEYYSTRSDYSRRRRVVHPLPCYDFTAPSDELWSEWYPSYKAPSSFSDSAAGDTRYLSFADIDIEERRADCWHTEPAVYKQFQNKAVKYNGVADWSISDRSASTKGFYMRTVVEGGYKDMSGTVSLSPSVYHQSSDVTSKYSVTKSSAVGWHTTTVNPLINLRDGNTHVIDCLTGYSYNGSDTVLGEVAFSVDIPNRRIMYTPLGVKGYEVKASVKGGWLDHADVVLDRGNISVDKKIAGSIDEINNGYTTRGDGFVTFAQPLYGYASSDLVYSKISDSYTVNDNISLYKVVTVPNDKLWIDRSDTTYSLECVSLSALSVSGSTVSGTGNVNIAVSCVNGSKFIYAKKYQDRESMSVKPYDSYVPGIAFGDEGSSKGNMGVDDTQLVYTLSWSMDMLDVLESLSAAIELDSGSSGELLDVLNLVNSATISEYDGSNQQVVKGYDKDVGTYSATFDVGSGTLRSPIQSIEYGVKSVSMQAASGSGTVTVPLVYRQERKNVKARFPRTDGVKLLSYNSNEFSVLADGKVVTISGTRGTVDGNSAEVGRSSIDGGFRYSVDYSVTGIVTMYVRHSDNGNVDDSYIYINGHKVPIAAFRGKASYVDVLSTDIRTPTKTDRIQRIDSVNEFQFLKQQWDADVSTENFWWIDDSHILALGQHELILRRKNGLPDDWNGDSFDDVWKLKRVDVLPSKYRKYGVACAYNTDRPPFWRMSINGASLQLDLLDVREEMEGIASFVISIVNRSIGEELNLNQSSGRNVFLYTYSEGVTVESLLSAAEFTATKIGKWLLFGIHYDTNLCQWTVLIDLSTNTVNKVFLGYGYVGLNGDLTGGQLPKMVVDTSKGFSGTVLPLDKLDSNKTVRTLTSIEEANQIPNEGIYGSSEQQWYVYVSVKGIVSHLQFNASNGTFAVQTIPMTNNFSAAYGAVGYEWASFYGTTPTAKSLSDMLDYGVAKNALDIMLSVLTIPPIVYFSPTYTRAAHVQQTYGQYAYVHKNYSQSFPKREADDRDRRITFNKEGKADLNVKSVAERQIDQLNDIYTFNPTQFVMSAEIEIVLNNFISIIMFSFMQAAVGTANNAGMNTETNYSLVKDFGRILNDQAALNTMQLLGDILAPTSDSDTTLNNTVAGALSLDMFYSTSDKQRVMAGAGFVEHQFVGNCVAQSATNLQHVIRKDSTILIVKSLSIWIMEWERQALIKIAEGFDAASEVLKATEICGTSAAASALATSAKAINNGFMADLYESAEKVVKDVLDEIAKTGTFNSKAGVPIKRPSIEGRHNYGEKNEVFMYPCVGVPEGGLDYCDESVQGVLQKIDTPDYTSTVIADNIWDSNFAKALSFGQSDKIESLTEYLLCKARKVGCSDYAPDPKEKKPFTGLYAYWAAVTGVHETKKLPKRMAKVEGVSSFLPKTVYRNENIGVSNPVFAPSMQQDYIIDERWNLTQYCTYGESQWVNCKDTKLIDGRYSNMVITDKFCGVASPYVAVEIKKGLTKKYMRPSAVTPTALSLNCSGYNVVFDNKMYHGHDGIGGRLVDFVGAPGIGKNLQTYLYCIQVNDRFKRSNVIPANELQGNFSGEPVYALDTIDRVWTQTTIAAREVGLKAGTTGEDRDAIRWAIPVFTEPVSTLPAAVRTLTVHQLGVSEGVTSLCTDLMNTVGEYKAPLSVDFTIGRNNYRFTKEYICSVTTVNGIDEILPIAPCLGCVYLGSTPTEAYLYSKATRCYYLFTGGGSLTKMDMMERFRNVQRGYYDFVNQDVVMPSLMTFKRLNPDISDKDTETDNIIVPTLARSEVSGELPPPITTIFNDRSWYRVVSLPSGLAYQGPNRVIINRSVFVEYMLDTMKSNLGKWERLPREKYSVKRDYHTKYEQVDRDVESEVFGWTHNPFVLVTSPLGVSEQVDCMFEWRITFCWTVEMDLLYGVDNFVCVNIMAETMCPGGKKRCRPTHIFLTKELFTRNDAHGYYTFKFNSNNGSGNRERLYIWSDGYIAVSSLTLAYKQLSAGRTEQLTQQVDVQRLKEL